MAPELFEKAPFDEKVDVFAFGTLIWELVAEKIPFEGVEAAEIKKRVTAGKQLNFPVGFPSFFESLVTDCRAKEPENRPTFEEIIKRFNN